MYVGWRAGLGAFQLFAASRRRGPTSVRTYDRMMYSTRTDHWTGRRMDGWMDGWMDGGETKNDAPNMRLPCQLQRASLSAG